MSWPALRTPTQNGSPEGRKGCPLPQMVCPDEEGMGCSRGTDPACANSAPPAGKNQGEILGGEGYG